MKLSTVLNQYILPTGLFALAGALVFFTIELASIRKAIPHILETVAEVEKNLEPVLEEVEEIRLLVPSIVDQVEQVRKEIPAILEEVARIRTQVVPMVLAEVAEISNQIPVILEEVDELTDKIPPILEESARLRSELPALLEESKAYREIAQAALVESEGYREIVPEVLLELEALREVIPEFIDEANELVANISTAGQEAAEGATKGFFTGIIKAPINLLGGVSESLFPSKKYSKEDKGFAESAIITVLESSDLSTFDTFENPNTGVHGEVHVIDVDAKKRKTCKDLRVIIWKKDVEETNIIMTFCKKKGGDWGLVE